MHLDGANASAEDADEGTDEAVTSGVNVVLNHRLVETGEALPSDRARNTTSTQPMLVSIEPHHATSGN